MGAWTFFDYVELTGRNPVREWLDGLPEEDMAKIDYRLRNMCAMARWSEKWISKYRGTDDIFELRISGNKVEYRPLGTYYGARRFVILAGAIEKGDKIPKSDIETAKTRLSNLKKDSQHARLHQFDGEGDLEEDEE
jgi:phage-related protein